MSNPQFASSFFDFNWNQPSGGLPNQASLMAPYPGYDYNHYFNSSMMMPGSGSPLLLDLPGSFCPPMGPTPPPLDYSQFYTNGLPNHFAQIFVPSTHANTPASFSGGMTMDPFEMKNSGPVIFDPRILSCEGGIKAESKDSLVPAKTRRSSVSDVSFYDSSEAGDTPPALFKSHKSGKLHYCGQEGCDYKTDRKNNLFRHARTMHGFLENGRLQPCCGHTFHTKTQYRQHIRACHSDGYKCSWGGCPKVFPRKALLMRHFKIHTGEKAFFCTEPDCAYTTNHKSNLDRHINIHQKRGLSSSPRPSPGGMPCISPKIEMLPPTSSSDSETTIHHFSFTVPDPHPRHEGDPDFIDHLSDSPRKVEVQLSYPKLTSMPSIPLLFDEDPPEGLEHQSILSDINPLANDG